MTPAPTNRIRHFDRHAGVLPAVSSLTATDRQEAEAVGWENSELFFLDQQTMPKQTPRRGKTSETSDQMVVDKYSLAMCVVALLKDETIVKRMKEVLFFFFNFMDSIVALTSKVVTLTREVDDKKCQNKATRAESRLHRRRFGRGRTIVAPPQPEILRNPRRPVSRRH